MVKHSSSVWKSPWQTWNSTHNFGIPGTILEFHHEGLGITKTSGVAGTVRPVALRFGPVEIFGVHGTSRSPAWGVRLTTVDAVTETCRTPRIQDREIHSFNLTY